MPTHEPSRTALVVAGGVVLAARDPALRVIVPPDAAALSRVLLGAGTQGRRLLRWIDARTGRAALRALERCTIPGIVAHWNCRKRWMEGAWERAHAEGFDTLLVAGSGFDTLSLRVARRGAVRTIDVDHPATLAARRSGIACIGAAPILLEHDLSAPGLGRVLGGSLPPAARTFVVIEGVLMYLDARRVAELFAELAALPCVRIRVAFTFMETPPAGGAPSFRPRSRLVDAWLARRGEPFRSGMAVESLRVWLRELGFELQEIDRAPGHSLVPAPLPQGECAAIAERLR